MMRLSPQTLSAVVVVGCLALAAFFTARPPGNAPDSYASTDYGPDGYRAWAALLAREGIATERFVLRPIELDDRIDTLVSAPPPASATRPASRAPADVAALAAWVRRGGRLVQLGRTTLAAGVAGDALELPYVLPHVGRSGRLRGSLAPRIGTLDDAGFDRLLLVEHPGRSELADRNGDFVVRYALGRGEVIAAVDPAMFANAHIAVAGNARLADLLATPRRPGGIVAFDDALHGALVDRPWYRALPLGLRVSLALLALALVIALVGAALRNGPPIRLAPPREPTSGEFVAALAALHERAHARSYVRNILARDALAAAARRAGLSERALPVEVAARLAPGPGPGGAAVGELVQALDIVVTTDAQLLWNARLAHAVRRDSSYDGNGNGNGRRSAFTGGPGTRRRR